ncbi:PrgH/EprH family type III secretion apparatus protein [Erwiniaceae bacterium BAC15a-03b]|uniref:PrgH/EprH family type III secretion apparatus protein n=1 Tax=Winslowiella arboricola TaxID=2978220 RepID=A0A9J6PUF1_9GAMM|nr:PrgH/EprH family type III secretion apparatus protein [Winslowiella arboricola]MCU5773753.1 PrgH/EprH family type III secretion apparatus protein [Winslowiella arboricola]MCU5777663.1 PrgH/EprH family type III secretion apparatus protein [Winslowiella arboricola]
MSTEDMKRHYEIRFINTRLAGCEYIIREERTSFVVADRSTLAAIQQQSQDPATIYVLDDNITTSFDIIYGSAMLLPRLEINNDHPRTSETINFHQVIEVDGVSFMLRPEGSEWQESAEEPQPEPPEEITASVSGVAPPQVASASGFKKIIISALLLLLTALAGYYLLQKQNWRQNSALALIPGGKPHQYKTFTGGDAAVYVLAPEPMSSVWALQSLIKNNIANQFTVLSARAEEDKITREINARWPQVKFHGVRFDDPSRPEIILSLERTEMLNQEELDHIAKKLISLFQWANDFIFSYISDKSIADNAGQALLSIVPDFDTRKNKDSVTFSITRELNDSELNALKIFIREFRSKWQGGYVQFDIKLEDNRLKGKSWRYGADGYIKTSADQWVFSPQN